jgi:RNA polymerase sigma-70 factor (ECF subfamily)
MAERVLSALDDVEILAEAARGEVQALATLYDRYASLLVTLARRMLGDPIAAEDLVQDVFMEVWRRADAYDPSRGSVRTWIVVRLRSRALDRLRSAPARREVATDVVSTQRPAPEPEDPQLAPDRRAVVHALAELPEDQRVVLELAYFQGLSMSEIAETVGVPIGTVKSRTAAALGKLRLAMNAGTKGARG